MSILTECEMCGEVEIPSRIFTITFCKNTGDYNGAFVCPDCCERNLVTFKSPSHIKRLITIGVPVLEWSLPLTQTMKGRPLNMKDYADFTKDLDNGSSCLVERLEAEQWKDTPQSD